MKKKEAKQQGKHAMNEKRRAFPKRKPYIAVLIVMAITAIVLLSMMIVVDTLPPDLTVILTLITLGLLMLTSFMLASRHRWKRIIGIALAIIFMLICIPVTSFMGDTYAMINKISDSGTDATGPAADKVDVTEEAFNVYITGIDQWASEKGEDLERSDVNMIVSINPRTKKILMTSIPRDSYVELYTAQQMDKLTHTGIYGVDETLNTVEKWLGIDLNYYVKINFSAVRDIIDAMGGIDVYSPTGFHTSLFNIEIKQGWNHMSGKRALYFARERKAFEGQDATRVENQQRVMEAVIKKLTSSTTLLTRYGDIMSAAGNNLQTNMSSDEMKELVKMQIAELSTWDIDSQKIEGEYGEDYVASLTQAMKFSVYIPDEQSVKKCKEGIEKVQSTGAEEQANQETVRRRSFFINAFRRALGKVNNSEAESELSE